MPLNTAGIQVGAAAIAGAITHVSLHTDTTLTSETAESAAGREPATVTATGGVVTVPSTDFTGGTPSGPVRRVGYWSAATGGTFYGSDLLVGDQAFNAAGEYTLTSAAITGTSSA